MVQASRLGLRVGDVVELPARPGAVYRGGLVVAFSGGSKGSGGVLVQVIWRGGGAATWHPVGVLRRVEG
jgi:hypothetical protein